MLNTLTLKLTNVLIAIGAAMLSLMMFLTALDVGLRYIFNSPLSGALELVEYMMAIIIPFSIAYCEFQKRHVAVELIMGRFPPKVRWVTGVITGIFSVFFIFILTWQSILEIIEIYHSKLTSAVLLIPTWPFVIPVALGIGLFALLLLHHFIQHVTKNNHLESNDNE
jgi:TRAP-type C4-dicarboxylate transport system permease small subunit